MRPTIYTLQKTVDIGFNYRTTFSTFKISLRKGQLTWAVGQGDATPQVIATANATLTQPMTTRIILRTNFRKGDPGYMPDHVFEVAHFKFTPAI